MEEDSQFLRFDPLSPDCKRPQGTLLPGGRCSLQVLSPATRVDWELGGVSRPMEMVGRDGCYRIFRCSLTLPEPGLYWYGFRVEGRRFGPWQITCVPEEYTVPDWAKGAVIYQIFPDRFARLGQCDLSEKLGPYLLHESWQDEPYQAPPGQPVRNHDFFGGNFRGICHRLSHIAALGAEILYLNPICMAYSNHRYDTADYLRPDPMLGTPEDFRQLCDQAHRLGMRVILDGVFSHTGADSRYFDRENRFGGGAYWDPQSPYRDWYRFREKPGTYECWWGFDTLPVVDKEQESYLAFVEEQVLPYWIGLGADGFRLDVVDELPDSFLRRFRRRLRELKPDAYLLGECWEDASNKVAYGVRRRYFTDGTLDGVMNYPLRTAILAYLRGQDDGQALRRTVLTLQDHYPCLNACMNLLGSHDTPRILTELGSPAAVMQASFLQFTLPGCPSIYYGDEAGLTGGRDPMNRRPYPWGKEDPALLSFYRELGRLRRYPALRSGRVAFFASEAGRLGYLRGENMEIYVNLGDTDWTAPAGTVRLGSRVRFITSRQLILEPGGFCAQEV